MKRLFNSMSCLIAGGVIAATAVVARADEEGGCCGGGSCAVGQQGSACCSADKAKAAKGLSTAAVKELLASAKPPTVLDARSGKYDDGKRIPGAKQLSPSADEAEIAKLLPDKGAAIVTYCAGVKCPASGMLAGKLRKLGYTNVSEYPEGIAGWIAAGNSVDEKK